MEILAILGPIAWLVAVLVGSIIYRRRSGKPVFPRVPDNALFAEAWRSGRSMKNALTRFGGGRNCLLVYVADGALTIVPVFPFNLLFLPEIYGLEAVVPISSVTVTPVSGWLGRRLLLEIDGPKTRRFELSLNDQDGFQAALKGKRAALAEPSQAGRSGRTRASWRQNFFRVFALVWGVGAASAGFVGLKEDMRFRSQGAVVTGKIVGHTGEGGSRNDNGIVQYEVAGRPYTLTSIRGSGIYKIGDLEEIHYMPNNPASAREGDYLVFDLIFASIGSCMLILGLALGRIARAFARQMNV